MKTLTKPRLFPQRTTSRTARPNQVVAAIRGLPDRALFWAGSLLLISGVLDIEKLSE